MKVGTAAIVLAAGAGTRMASDLPKPLQPVAGRAMVLRVLDALVGVDPDPIVVVVGHEADQVRTAISADAPQPERMLFAQQAQQLGTGDAARVGLESLTDASTSPPTEPPRADEAPIGRDEMTFSDDPGDAARDPDDAARARDVLILPGDAPLLRPATLHRLVESRRRSGVAVSLLGARVQDPAGYGRIVRDGPNIRIVEQRDATDAEAQISEINAGVYCFEITCLRTVIPRIRRANSAAEYYLTDAIGLLDQAGEGVTAITSEDPTEAVGVNDPSQLAACESILAART